MNVIAGELEGGSFMAGEANVKVPVKGRIREAVLGVRPEDCTIVAPDKGALKGSIYAVELIGDHTLVTLETGTGMLTVKAPKDFTAKLNETAGVALTRESLFVFDKVTGARLR
jgi:multiple sugar transport system ATP-binding protein